MTYHKIILHLMLLFSTVTFSYSQEVVTCKAVYAGQITEAQSKRFQARFNNWYYSKGETFSHSWSMGNNYNNSLPYYPTNTRTFSPPAVSYIRYAPRPNCRVSVSGNKMRTFTSKDGRTFEGRLLSINATNKTARVRTEKGLAYNVSISKFCSSDISYLKSWWTKRNPPKQLTGYRAFLARRESSKYGG